MPEFGALLHTSGFIPHGHCYRWQPLLVWLHLVSDSLIALAYYSIPVSLVYFAKRRADLPFRWVFWVFGAFIVACGTTHLMDVWTLWHPTYWLSGALKALTAFLSVATAAMLYWLVPHALLLPSPRQWEMANARLLEVQRIARLGYWEYDVLTQAVTWSEEMFRLFGLLPLPVPPHATRLQFYEPESRVQLEQAVQAALRDGTPYALELQCTPPDGTTRWFLKRGEAIRDTTGHVVKLVGTILDLTDQKQHEQLCQLNQTLETQVQQRTAALQQQLRFESLLKQITDQVRDSLDEAQILQAAVTALGQGLAVDSCETGLYDLEEWQFTIAYEYATALPSVLGQVASLDYPPGIHNQLLADQPLQFCWVSTDALRQIAHSHAILACPLQDERGVFGDLWLFRADGEGFSEPEVRLVQQVANQCAIALRQARLYAVAQQQLHAVEQLNRLKDDFLSTVSHELRSPLASIKLSVHLLELILRQCEPPFTTAYGAALANKVWRYLTILAVECERELTLVNDLLELQRLEAGVVSVTWSPVDLRDWLSELVPAYAERTQSRQQTLQLQVPATLPRVRSDVSLLTSVWRELLTNACKYTPPGGVISVQASATETSVQVSVSNTGPPIPPEVLPHLFDKFYRVPGADQWQQGGTGLGLALVKSQVARLGGILSVTSDDTATVFGVTLPLEPA